MTRSDYRAGALGLLEQILKGNVDRPDAACIGEGPLYDRARWPEDAADHADHLQAVTDAVRVCARCPHTADCADAINPPAGHKAA